jgi:hypothetical protein
MPTETILPCIVNWLLLYFVPSLKSQQEMQNGKLMSPSITVSVLSFFLSVIQQQKDTSSDSEFLKITY